MKTFYLEAICSTIFLIKCLALVSGKLEIGCYFPSWTAYRKQPNRYDMNSIPANTCDHLYYAFITVDLNTWKVKNVLPFEDPSAAVKFSPSEIKKRSPKTNIFAALGGYTEGVKVFSDLVSNKQNRDIFVRDVVDYLNRYNFDGLDIDWEFPGDTDRGGRRTDKDNLTLLVKELRQSFNSNKKRLLLTMAVPTFRGLVENGYDVKSLSEHVDWFNVMTYDMRGPWTNTADNHAPLYRRSFDTEWLKEMNVHDSLKIWTDLGCPANKIVMGIPFYARSFTLKPPYTYKPNSPIEGKGNPGEVSQEGGILHYSEVCQFLKSKQWSRGYDNVAFVPYIYTGDQWAGYDDEESIKKKMEFAANNGYKGAMAWALDQDDFLANCGHVKHPLLMAMKNNA